MRPSIWPFKTNRDLDEVIAQKIMGWELWQGDWYTPWDVADQRRTWRANRLWSPTSDADASQLLWVRCLDRVRKEGGGRISVRLLHDGQIHVRAEYDGGLLPAYDRHESFDPDFKMGLCFFAIDLFHLDFRSTGSDNKTKP